MAEHRVDPQVMEQLWEQMAPHFSRGIEAVLSVRGRAIKTETITGLLKIAYQSGVVRGYDMGWTVFGDGE